MTKQHKYPFGKIEKKWQKIWEKTGLFEAEDFSSKPKQYILIEFPYPSGDGLHVGHARSYTALDIISRKKRMEGYNVLYPIGWDAFGLPTENYAIKKGIHPAKVTERNIKIFKQQLKSLGLSFDWSREVNTTDPKYYKWTQWIFLQFFKAGLAYQAEMPINWCPSCKIGLANEEVIQGKCERCGAETEKRQIKQWMLRITKYADRLIEDLNHVDYPDKIKTQQINWIGRSEGTNLKFQIQSASWRTKFQISVFTTRVDTIFGVTAVVLAPEHSLISNIKYQISNWNEVEDYIKKAKVKSDLERAMLSEAPTLARGEIGGPTASRVGQKTGVELKGIKIANPLNNQEVSLWVGDYVVATYGGGSVMVVPAHDQRDFDFAQKYNLPIIEVIKSVSNHRGAERGPNGELLEAFEEKGVLINSGDFTGLNSEEAIKKITNWLAERKIGGLQINYKLRDWIFSRQHYWGEPIPIIHCPKCGVVAVPENDLPVELPYVKKYQPTGTGESPLAQCEDWLKVKCPKCGGPGRRETDTMPNWAGSSWYYLRYTDPRNKHCFADFKKLEYWLAPARQSPKGVGGVDIYNGGMEHTTLHLLYSRFWHKFLYDQGLVPFDEPYTRRHSHGMVLGESGEKMSKSRGNVVNPDEIVEKYGADVLRIYEMFMGPFDQPVIWSAKAIEGMNRFIIRIYNFYKNHKFHNEADIDKEVKTKTHQLIKKITEDLDGFKFNTAMAAFMEYFNFVEDEAEKFDLENAKTFLALIAPFMPHLAEELWQSLRSTANYESNTNIRITNRKKIKIRSIFEEKWPAYDKNFINADSIEYVAQVNGKLRDRFAVPTSASEEEVKEIALKSEKIKNFISDKKILKIIFVPKRLINFVVS